MTKHDDLLETYAYAAAEAMQKEMDNQIIYDHLKNNGWTPCTIDAWRHASQTKVKEWCDTTIGKTGWWKSGNNFLFKEEKHATLFLLKWS
jgi:hypothetical protein